MKKLFLYLLMPLAMGLASCNREPVSTSSAKVMSCSKVILNGELGDSSEGEVGFCYSSTENDPTPDNSEHVEFYNYDSSSEYNIEVAKLRPSTTYYFRAYRNTEEGQILAPNVLSFTTPEFQPEAIDLGLSVKWASCNIGALAPEEYGDYFAWGETAPKKLYDWSTYKLCNGTDRSLTKYCYREDFGTVDNKEVLELEDDAAAVNWGGNWRTPTQEEFVELVEKCAWTWRTENGVYGCAIVAPNGNCIFIPASGMREGDELINDGVRGCYWTSNAERSIPIYYQFHESGGVWIGNTRCNGRPVRAVCP